MNVRSLRTLRRRQVFLKWVKQQNFQVLCIQETKLSPEFKFKVEDHKTVVTEDGSMGGVGIICTNDVEILSSMRRKNVVKIRTMVNGKKTSIITVYLHYRNQNRAHDDRSAMYEWAKRSLRDGDQVILTGDFNDHYDQVERNLIEIGLTPTLGPKAVTREIKFIKQSSRIDNVFLSDGLSYSDVKLKPVLFTDHKYIRMDVK